MLTNANDLYILRCTRLRVTLDFLLFWSERFATVFLGHRNLGGLKHANYTDLLETYNSICMALIGHIVMQLDVKYPLILLDCVVLQFK